MLDVFKIFLSDLLSKGLARKTLRLHRDHVCALGGEITCCKGSSADRRLRARAGSRHMRLLAHHAIAWAAAIFTACQCP